MLIISLKDVSTNPLFFLNIFPLLRIFQFPHITEPLNLKIVSALKSKLLNLPAFKRLKLFFWNLKIGSFSLKTEKTISKSLIFRRLIALSTWSTLLLIICKFKKIKISLFPPFLKYSFLLKFKISCSEDIDFSNLLGLLNIKKFLFLKTSFFINVINDLLT